LAGRLRTRSSTYLHLGVIAGGPLWDLAIANSGFRSAERSAVTAELQQRLALLGPPPNLWNPRSRTYRLANDFVDAYRSFVRGRNVTDVPPAADYAAGTPRPDRNSLETGTHGQLRRNRMNGRESHHTTQYLLVSYLRNQRSRQKPFPNPGTRTTNRHYPPGIVFAGGQVTSIRGSGGTLDLTALDTGERGDAMPAISLAADTHRRAQLHLEREYSWNPDTSETTGTASQANAVHNEFRRHLAASNSALVADSIAVYNAWVDSHDTQAENAFFTAATETYRWIHGRMIPALERGLASRERAYYLGIAARAQHNVTSGQYHLTAAHMGTAFRRARDNNNAVMTAAGFQH
jgi:hypothetical protein